MVYRFKATAFPFAAAETVDANIVTVEGVDATDVLEDAANAALVTHNLDHLAGTATGIPALPTGTYLAGLSGVSLAATGLDAITATEPTGKPTTFPGWIMWLVQRFRRADKTSTVITVKTEAGATVTTQAITSSGDNETLGPPS